MRALIEAKIAQLEADLSAEREKLSAMLNDIPAEFHSMTQEMLDKIKRFFE